MTGPALREHKMQVCDRGRQYKMPATVIVGEAVSSVAYRR